MSLCISATYEHCKRVNVLNTCNLLFLVEGYVCKYFVIFVDSWQYASSFNNARKNSLAQKKCWQVSENREMDSLAGHSERVYKAGVRSSSSLRTLRTLLKGKIHPPDPGPIYLRLYYSYKRQVQALWFKFLRVERSETTQVFFFFDFWKIPKKVTIASTAFSIKSDSYFFRFFFP